MSLDHRQTAAAWHSGQSSPLYAYASSGAIAVGVDDEILDCLGIVERGELDIEFDAVDEHERLLALLRHVEPELAKDRASDLGRDHGESAAAWWEQDALGGRATEDTTATAERVLRGIEDGDPLVLDALPGWDSIASSDEIVATSGWPEPDADDRDAHDRWQAAQASILDAYTTAFVDAFLASAAASCRSELSNQMVERSDERFEQDFADGGSLVVHQRRASTRPQAVQLEPDVGEPHSRSDGMPIDAVERAGPTSPFLRPTDRSNVDSPEGRRPTPPGWTVDVVGTWDGREVEAVYDPRRYEIMLTASEPTADVASAFEGRGMGAAR